MTSPQVLIVGAGPTGLISAISLLKNGVAVRIIDKLASYQQSSRGNGFQPRVQEVEHFLGTLEDVRKYAIAPPDVIHYDIENPSLIARTAPMVEHLEATPAFPINQPIMVNQDQHEAVLRKHLEALGTKVELSAELEDIQQKEDSATATIIKYSENGSVVEHATFSYIIGADGGKGIVRKLIGSNFIGETHETDKLLNADVDLEKPLEGIGFHIFGDERSLAAAFRSTNIPKRYQLLILGPKYHDIAEECAKAGLHELQSIVNKITRRPDLVITNIKSKADWKLNIRMAEKFQVGRVFIIGDAAHVHSPMGGQGMTTGIQDAFNLAWKMAYVIKGIAAPSLLESYEKERLPVVAAMLLETTKLHQKLYLARPEEKKQDVQSTIDALGRAAAPTADEGVDIAQKDEPLFRGRKLFQLGVNYRWSSIVLDDRDYGTGASGRDDAYGNDVGTRALNDVHAGDRAPDASGLELLSRSDWTPEKNPGRLFDVFTPIAHTALIFSSTADSSFVTRALDTLRKLPHAHKIVQTAVVVPAAASNDAAGVTDFVLLDKDGHAYQGYDIADGADAIVVVRPDGIIGAYVHTPEELDKYFAKIMI